MLFAVHHLDNEAYDSGSTVVEPVEDYNGLYSRPSQKGMQWITYSETPSDKYQVYTNLFPARHTWYLLATIIILNGIDWAGFELLAIGNQEIETLPTGYRVLDGLFQALGW